MPHAKHGLRLDLRTLILVLCALTALVMLCASYFASYRVQRQLLIDHALEANRVYAMKLASITETFIGNASSSWPSAPAYKAGSWAMPLRCRWRPTVYWARAWPSTPPS